jgi:DNA gyrase subunit A
MADPNTPTPQNSPISTSNIIDRDLKTELSTSYIDYAMSVIIGRAIPDIRDGLKPVQRRILYSMGVTNFYYNRPHRKCATIVGHVLGHFHPHGDSSVYLALVRLAQDFSVRYTLIDGQGNFGSIDGDAPAAYRYTEARLARISNEMLEDIDKDTVDFIENFDGSEMEPAYLPAKVPCLLLNGSTGIAVGMSTNMAPHNLREIVAAICRAIDVGVNNLSFNDIIETIQGPDFPTGGIIIGKSGILNAIHTGRGAIVIRSRAEIITDGVGKGKDSIIITEIPYMVNKSRLIEVIANLVHKNIIPEIADVRDESDRTGLRIVIELKRNTDSNSVLNRLYHKSQLQNSFNIINLAVVDNGRKPKQLNYIEIIQEFIIHRQLVIRRRITYKLDRAQKRMHILDGLLIAIDNIDEVVAIIRGSANVVEAKEKLMTKFQLSEIQATEILKMPLSRLTNLQTQKLIDEKTDLLQKIQYYQSLLADENKILEIIRSESVKMAELYGDDRRSEIIVGEDTSRIEYVETVPEEDCVLTITKDQKIKRMTLTQYRSQNRGGKGKRGMNMREEDYIQDMYIISSHDTILLFTQQGRIYSIPAYSIPLASRIAKGKAIVNYIQLKPEEKIIDIISVADFSNNQSCVIVSRNGIIKKVSLELFSNVRKNGIHCMSIRDEDYLVRAKKCNPGSEILIATKKGFAIRFKGDELRSMGRTAMGVIGIKLRGPDEVVDLVVADANTKIVTITKAGYGKNSLLNLYRLTHRGGKGVINIKLRSERDEVIATKAIDTVMNMLLASAKGIFIRIRSEDIRQTGRAAKGVIVMNLGDDDEITSVALCEPEDDEDEAISGNLDTASSPTNSTDDKSEIIASSPTNSIDDKSEIKASNSDEKTTDNLENKDNEENNTETKDSEEK